MELEMKVSEWKDRIAEVIRAHPKGKPLKANGSELPDPVPMAPPVGYKAAPSMFEIMREMVKAERLRVALEEEGLESPEEADDFDVGDDYEPHSPYEHNFDHVADPGELQRLRDAIDVRERELGIRRSGQASGSPPSHTGNRSEGGGAGAGGSPESEAAPRPEDATRGGKVKP